MFRLLHNTAPPDVDTFPVTTSKSNAGVSFSTFLRFSLRALPALSVSDWLHRLLWVNNWKLVTLLLCKLWNNKHHQIVERCLLGLSLLFVEQTWFATTSLKLIHYCALPDNSYVPTKGIVRLFESSFDSSSLLAHKTTHFESDIFFEIHSAHFLKHTLIE